MTDSTNFLTRTAGRIAGKIAGLFVDGIYEDNVTLDLCLDLVEGECKKFRQIKYFTLSVQENLRPKNENDNFIVMIEFLDFRRKTFIVDGIEDRYEIHAREIDGKIYELLKGKDSVTIQV